ncbi:MAG: hypothetical protein NXI25_02810 [bacterium]|nr:hypothetical protein [bacterium]
MEQLSAFGWDLDLLRQLQGLLIALGIGFANMDAITVSMSEYASGATTFRSPEWLSSWQPLRIPWSNTASAWCSGTAVCANSLLSVLL